MRLRFDISDTGDGLSPEALDGLFEPFHRGDKGPLGTGLGLAISRKLAELLGGTLDVHSQPGQGTTFSLLVPAELVESSTPKPAHPPTPTPAPAPARPDPPATARSIAPGSRRILLAEDHDDNRRALSRRLGMAGFEVTGVPHGGEAIDAALAASAEGRPFDVILMDMHMPVTDGYEATSHLRSVGYRGAIIALTADARSEDRDECLVRGCDEHLAKPVDWERLLSLIATFTPSA